MTSKSLVSHAKSLKTYLDLHNSAKTSKILQNPTEL